MAWQMRQCSSAAVEHMKTKIVAQLRGLEKNSFVRSIGVLVGGALGAQIILLVAMPFLTRMYSPEDFSVLGVYTAILGMFSIVACFGFDNAIPVPELESDAVNLLFVSVLIAAVTGTSLAIVVFAWPQEIGAILRQPAMLPYLWMLPLGVFLAGAYSALQFWSARQKAFSLIARSRIMQSGGGVGVQLGLGLIGLAPFGLLFGQLINSGAGVILLVGRLFRCERHLLASATKAEMRAVIRRHDRFAKYTTPELLANSATVQLPVIIIAAVSAGPEAGFLLLAMRVIQTPMALVGNAISQVYYAQAPDAFRVGSLPLLSAGILRQVAKFGIGPLIFASIVASEVFAIAFGERWGPSGTLVAWMAPWMIVQLLASPISMALYAVDRQQTAMFLQASGLVIRVLPVVIAAKLAPGMLSEVFALSSFAFYAIYLTTLVRVIGVSWALLGEIVRDCLPIVAVSGVAGIVLKLLLILVQLE